MNKKIIIILIASTLSLAAINNANAGSLVFHGKVLGGVSCNVAPDSESTFIEMGYLSSAMFGGKAGISGPAKGFSIQLSDCPENIDAANVTFEGTSADGVNTILALTDEASSAQGLGIQILEHDTQTVIPLGQQSRAQNLKPGFNSLQFATQVVSTTNKVTAGDINAVAVFSIAYN